MPSPGRPPQPPGRLTSALSDVSSVAVCPPLKPTCLWSRWRPSRSLAFGSARRDASLALGPDFLPAGGLFLPPPAPASCPLSRFSSRLHSPEAAGRPSAAEIRRRVGLVASARRIDAASGRPALLAIIVRVARGRLVGRVRVAFSRPGGGVGPSKRGERKATDRSKKATDRSKALHGHEQTPPSVAATRAMGRSSEARAASQEGAPQCRRPLLPGEDQHTPRRERHCSILDPPRPGPRKEHPRTNREP